MEVEFAIDEHAYYIGKRQVPNVTSIISPLRPPIPLHLLDEALKRGRYIHKATELDDKGELDIASLDARIVPYLEAWRLFKKQTGCEILEIEKRVYHSVLDFAGTLDRVLLLGGERAIIDIKRPVLDAYVGVQTAAYMGALQEQMLQELGTIGARNVLRRRLSKEFKARIPTKRYGVQLRDDGSYRLREFKDNEDWTVFVSLLNIQRWKEKTSLKTRVRDR